MRQPFLAGENSSCRIDAISGVAAAANDLMGSGCVQFGMGSRREMKTSVTRTILAIVLFCAPGFAHAAPITWGPDSYDPSSDVYFDADGAACTPASLSATCSSLTYSHDLTAYGFVPGASSSDQLVSAVLEILLRDDESDRPNEGFKFTLEGDLQPGTQDASTTFSFGDFTGSLLTSIQADGVLNVILTRQNGDFIFDQSIFTANGTRGDVTEEGGEVSAAVPEPNTMLLVAGGLAALAIRRRRTQRIRE